MRPKLVPRRRLGVATLAVILAAGVAPWTTGASAQVTGDRTSRMGHAPVGWTRQFTPEFLRRDMRFFTEQLGLDAAQRGIVEALLRDYETDFARATEEMRDAFDGLRPNARESDAQRARRAELRDEMRRSVQMLQDLRAASRPDVAAIERVEDYLARLREQLAALRTAAPQGAELERLQREVAEVSRRWQARRAGLRARLIDGLRAVLAERQMARWPDFDRALRRQKRLPQGRLSGESVDLTIALREIDATLEGDTQRVVDDYVRELDRTLVARDEQLEDARVRTILAMMRRDVDEAMAIATEESSLRAAVRDVNELYADAIAASLAPTERQAFVEAWRDRAYPGIYRPTPTHRAIRTALELNDLDPTQREAIRALRTRHERAIERQNASIVAATRAREAGEMLRRMRRWRGDDALDRNDPLADAMAARVEVDTRYRDELEAVLTAEQTAQLPARPADPRARAERHPFDLDGDGTLDDAERAAARRGFRAVRPGGG